MNDFLTKPPIWAAAACLTIVGVGSGVVLMKDNRTSSIENSEEVRFPVATEPPPSPEELASPHLRAAEQRALLLIEPQLAALDAFFHEAKRGSEAFVDSALSWNSKLKLITDCVAEDNGHEAHIREQIDSHLFTQDKLQATTAAMTSTLLTGMESIESQMLVDLRVDVEEFSAAYEFGSRNEKEIHRAYALMTATVRDELDSRLQAELGREVASLIASSVAAKLVVKLGVSAGLLGTGAASSWASFGIGLGVAIAADQLLEKWMDSKQQLITVIHEALDDQALTMRTELERQLEDYVKRRASLRQDAVMQLLQPNS